MCQHWHTVPDAPSRPSTAALAPGARWETSPTASLRVVLAALERLGLDLSDELARVGLTLSQARELDRRVPRSAYCALWGRVAEVSGDPDCGLTLAQAQEVGTMGVLEYVAINALTLRDGLERVARYGRLLHDGGIHEFRVEPRGGCLSYHNGAVPPTRAQIDWSFAYVLLRARTATRLDILPLELRVHYPRPASTARLDEVFRCPIVFDQPRIELWLPAGVLDRPHGHADAQLATLMAAFAEQQLASLPPGGPFQTRLHQAIARSLEQGTQPQIGSIARQMSMSTRSLQRRLSEESTSFTAVVGQVRLSLGASHLAQNRLAIGEIAFLLGYSSPGAFHRAFKRAYGCTPAVYRQTGRHRRIADCATEPDRAGG